MFLLRHFLIGIIIFIVVVFSFVQFVAINTLDTLIEKAEQQDSNTSPWFSSSNNLNIFKDSNPIETIFVGNNWQGTITVIALDGYKKLGVINGIPDKLERLKQVRGQFLGRVLYYGIRQLVGEGHDQFVDDMYSSIDGTKLIVSRPSFADVVAIDTLTGKIIWRFEVAGFRSDHMAISPDGKHVAVSASTGDLVHILDVDTGKEHGQFPSGDSPHENIYSKDGKHIFHASIGNVFSPFDFNGGGLLKGKRVVQVVETDTYTITEQFDMRDKLDDFGLPEVSPSVRPMAHTSSEDYFYFQLSFLHGFVEYHMPSGEITRKIDLPKVTKQPRTKYVNDSAHHGIAISADDKTLCVAGTMDNYVAIVDIASENCSVIV